MFITRTFRVTLLVALLILTAGTISIPFSVEAKIVERTATTVPYTEMQIIEASNKERIAKHLTILAVNKELSIAAQRKADDMAKNSYFAHYSPAGVSPWDWLREVGYNYVYAGENLAVHFTTLDTLMQAWMHSPSHRANIVNMHYLETGVGIAQGIRNGAPGWFVVQVFGTEQ